jgi:uncharacterized protein (DUF427 family)
MEAVSRRLRVEAAGITLAETTDGFRILETSHPPVYYFPAEDVRMDLLRPGRGSSFCEYKGRAIYYDLAIGARTPGAERAMDVEHVAWTYPTPSPGYAAIAHHLAFYAGRVDACFVDDERVEPQPGGFYGGWVTRDLIGPFKGAPGTSGW